MATKAKAPAAGTTCQEAMSKIKAEAQQGFRTGREAGNHVVTEIPFAAGAAAGFGFGVTEAIVGAVAAPFNWLLGGHESHEEAETA